MSHRAKLGPYSLSVGGSLDAASLPLLSLGTEVIFIDEILTRLQGIRGVAGSSGTTTIELELNGIGTGHTLSWTNADADNALKTTTISLSLATGDRLSFKLTSAEIGAEDVFLQVSN